MTIKQKLLLLFSVLLIVYGCGKKDKSKEEKIEAAVPVKVTQAKTGNIYETISLAGDAYGQEETNIYSKVPGKLLKKLKSEGDLVKEGETIALVERDEEAMEFASAEVRSPIDGIVTHYFVGLGEYVFPSQSMSTKPIAMVSNTDNVIVEVYASEKDMGRIRKGQSSKVTADVYGDRGFRGKVTEVDTAADPSTRKTKIKISVPNKEHYLKSGMFVRAEIIVGGRNGVLLVPSSAIVKKLDKESVFVIEDDRAKEMTVVTGTTDGEKTEIKNGLKINQRVIYEGNFGLLDGTKVEMKK